MAPPLKSKRLLVPVAVVASLVLGVAAYAFFTSSGSGTGSASVGSSTAFTVSVAPATGGPLFPGAGSQSLAYTVTNPSSGGQQLSSTSASVAASSLNITQGGIAVPGCLAAWFTAANTAPTGLPRTLAGSGTASGSVTVTMQDPGVNQDACQAKSPDITVTAG